QDKHLDPNRARSCLPRNLPVPIQNIIPASTSIDDLISFDKNITTYYPNVSNIPVVDFLTSDIPDSKIQSNREQKEKTFLTIDELIK
ncbi:4419_t:CDS:1, partial [Cetraspora pellucida]